jgi:predicted ATPase/DNA-binding SARP family transcriptional activator
LETLSMHAPAPVLASAGRKHRTKDWGMEFRLLGPLEVYEDGGHVLPLGAPKQRALLALLLLQANEVVLGDRLIDGLWGESPPPSAANMLQGYVSRLRRLLEPERRRGANSVLLTRAPGYLLRVEPEEIDANRFERLFVQAQAARDADPVQATALLREALALWRGPPLADFAFDSFAQAEIARLEELRLAALVERIDLDLALGRDAELVGELEKLVAEWPLQERLRGQLMLALYRSGRPGDALALYRDTRRLLVEELGMEPGRRLRELEQAILQADPGLDISPEHTRSNLPLQPTPLVGRERELCELRELLSFARLVTLTGAGGSGKTRLALQVAAEVVEAFRDGVFWVSLAALGDPDLVIPTVAATVGAKGDLARFVDEKEMLLLLDNLEQIVDCAPALAVLLGACPSLKLLATSRAPLRISGEQEYEVPPLPQPEAVELFTQRARQVELQFEPDAAVTEVCRRLDGLPLAVELAAAQVRLLPPEQILARLGHSLDLLELGARDAPGRQQTLRATFAWSHDLLHADEQEAFARLAVFSGGSSLEAAETVCSASLRTLARLVEQSLVRRGGGGRLAMLETTHEFALERLEQSGEADDLRRRHAAFFSDLVFAAQSELRTANELAWFERLNAEHDNIRSALDYLAVQPDPIPHSRVAAGCWYFWSQTGHLIEGRERLRHALARADDVPPEVRASLHEGLSSIEGKMGDGAEAVRHANASFRIRRELGEPGGLMRSLVAGATAAEVAGQSEVAVALHEECAAVARSVGDAWFLALSSINLGVAAFRRKEFERSRDLEAEALAVGKDVGDSRLLDSAVANLAAAEIELGEYNAASDRLLGALARSSSSTSPEILCWCLEGLAAIEARAGDPEQGARLLGAVESIAQDIGYSLQLMEYERHERTTAMLAESLGEIAMRAAVAHGRRMGLNGAVAYALAPAD